jgi:hypothetical protein
MEGVCVCVQGRKVSGGQIDLDRSIHPWMDGLIRAEAFASAPSVASPAGPCGGKRKKTTTRGVPSAFQAGAERENWKKKPLFKTPAE